MTFAQEWTQLKQNAAGRMRLDSAETESTGGAGDLKSSQAAWRRAGEGVGSLREGIRKALTKLDEGQKGLGKDAGCQTAAAQQAVLDSWKRYAKDVSKRCGELRKAMEQTGHDHANIDQAVKDEVDKLKTKYEDTPAVGGRTGHG
ncbi:hypothetical protein [Streptomyces rugosispiralis]|uniref:Uncharacterized protein n=1 Tax=Streptomyces rugosispiralis TaxID=2967341 RepID=A0ABT1V4M6_9ACTN|nr:hypothetical protein [Streptomyces rugosispiralis]MCQ8191506.1 hypothetical protein [Streptomyces rugosispiralis]